MLMIGLLKRLQIQLLLNADQGIEHR